VLILFLHVLLHAQGTALSAVAPESAAWAGVEMNGIACCLSLSKQAPFRYKLSQRKAPALHIEQAASLQILTAADQ
jgi:hypothetical protein